MKLLRPFGLFLFLSLSVHAGEADVLSVDVACDTDSVCSFAVSVKHEDEGWEHYANKWEILDDCGEIIAVRELAHPHVDEQPFTRSLDNVKIPSFLKRVVIRAHDSVHEYGGKEIVVKLPRQ